MRNAARWDEEVDTPWVTSVIDGFGGRPEALVAIFRATRSDTATCPSARCAWSATG